MSSPGSIAAAARVVLVSHSARPGGAELCLLELAEGLVRFHGAQVDVVLPARGPLAAMLAAVGARPHVVRHHGWATANVPRAAAAALMASNVFAVMCLASWFRRQRPHVVATNSITNPAGAYAARAAGVPHIWFINEFGDLDHGYRFALGLARTLRVVDRLSARVVTCSRALARRVGEQITAGKVEVAYYAVTTGLNRPLVNAPGKPGAPRVLILGRQHPGKGQTDAIAAIARLRERGCMATLRIAGEGQGSYGRELERRCAGLDDGAVTILQRVDDAVAEIDACDVLLLCSRCEAFGRVVVEAMKRGRPVVVTGAGGAQELVVDSGGGLLYPPGDDAALADAIARLARDPAEARRLGEAGRAWAARQCTLPGYAGAFLGTVQRARG